MTAEHRGALEGRDGTWTGAAALLRALAGARVPHVVPVGPEALSRRLGDVRSRLHVLVPPAHLVAAGAVARAHGVAARGADGRELWVVKELATLRVVEISDQLELASAAHRWRLPWAEALAGASVERAGLTTLDAEAAAVVDAVAAALRGESHAPPRSCALTAALLGTPPASAAEVRSRLAASRTARAPERVRLPPGGGRIIAILGSDGAGKTTQAEALRAWLGAALDVRSVHLGRGDAVAEARQALANLKWEVLERVSGGRRPGPSGPVDDGGVRRAAGASPRRRLQLLLRDLSRVSLARRKRRELSRAARLRGEGAIVITDRFPDRTRRELDGPGITISPGDPPIRRALAYLERREYARMRARPDLVLVLQVPPEVAHARVPDHRLEDIRRKGAALDSLDLGGAVTRRFEADCPIDEVQERLRASVWDALHSTSLGSPGGASRERIPDA